MNCYVEYSVVQVYVPFNVWKHICWNIAKFANSQRGILSMWCVNPQL